MINLIPKHGLSALGMTQRDVYKAALGVLARRVAIDAYDRPMLPFSDELPMLLKDRAYRKQVIGVGAIVDSFFKEGIDGYKWKDALQTILSENSVTMRQILEDAEDEPGPIEVNDEIVDSVFGEIVGIFLIPSDDANQASDDGVTSSVARSPMIASVRDVLHDVLDRVGTERIFPDVHQELTRL